MNEAAPRSDRWFLAATLAVQAAAATWSAHQHRDVLNPDGIAYVLNARHALAGEWSLAVNGYWGPLFSWILAPILAAGTEAVLAAHLASALVSLVFTWGAHEYLRATIAHGGVVRIATVIVAAAAVTWAAEVVTPDLLLAGLLAAFAARINTAATWTAPRKAFVAGLWLGAAYLAKAVALPSGVAFLACLVLVGRWIEGAAWRPLLRTCGFVAAGCAVLALPWITALTVHYGKPAWSTTGPIAHAVVGPGDRDRSYPTFRTFHTPEAGRITSWEEPTVLTYETWSPIQDWTHFRHQGRVVANNAFRITGYVKEFDFLGLGVASAVLGLLLVAASRAGVAAERWRWSALAAASVAAPYLVVFAYGDRYFWAAYPFLVSSAFGLALRATREATEGVRRAAVGLVAGSFALGLVSFHVLWYPYSTDIRPSLRAAFVGRSDTRVAASRKAAVALLARGVAGGVHSDIREGLYVAFFAGVPWHGQEAAPSPDRLDEVGARVVVTKSGSDLDRTLAALPAWSRLDLGPGSFLAVFTR